MSKSRNSPKLPVERNPPDDLHAPDGRSPAARAAEWASRIMTISLEMVVPGLAGYWLDTKLGTKFVLMLAGFAIGFAAAMKHLLYLTSRGHRRRPNHPPSTNEKEHEA